MKKLKNAKDEKMFTIDGAKEDIKDSALPKIPSNTRILLHARPDPELDRKREFINKQLSENQKRKIHVNHREPIGFNLNREYVKNFRIVKPRFDIDNLQYRQLELMKNSPFEKLQNIRYQQYMETQIKNESLDQQQALAMQQQGVALKQRNKSEQMFSQDFTYGSMISPEQYNAQSFQNYPNMQGARWNHHIQILDKINDNNGKKWLAERYQQNKPIQNDHMQSKKVKKLNEAIQEYQFLNQYYMGPSFQNINRL